MARIFVVDGREMPDHDPNLSIADVQRQLATFYPEVANAQVSESKRGDDDIYEFRRQVGVKGNRR